MEKKSEFDNVTTINTSELPLPNCLQVETILDTALFSQKGIWYTATLQPEETLSQECKMGGTYYYTIENRAQKNECIDVGDKGYVNKKILQNWLIIIGKRGILERL